MKHTNIRFALQLATVTAFMRAIDTAIEIISGSDDATGEARSMALSHFPNVEERDLIDFTNLMHGRICSDEAAR